MVSAFRISFSSGETNLCISKENTLGALCREEFLSFKGEWMWEAGQEEVNKSGRRWLELGVKWACWDRQERQTGSKIKNFSHIQ